MSGTVYFLRRGVEGPIKIGYTARNATLRQRAGQVFNTELIHLLVEVGGSREDEAKLHRLFRAQHLRGEWFHPGRELMELIDVLHEGVSLASYLAGLDEGEGRGRRTG